MTTIKSTTPALTTQRSFNNDAAVSQTQKATPQLTTLENTFSNGPAAQLPANAAAAPRRGIQRQLPTSAPAQAPQTAQAPQAAQAPETTQLQNTIQGGQNVRRGSSGPEVLDLQKALNAAGAQPPLDVDGKFGPLTEQAVRNFQTQRGIGVDGVVGPQTLGQITGGQTTTPTAPTQPTNPTDPTQPTNPTDPTQPTNPTDPTAPTPPGTAGTADARIGRIAGMENTTPEFRQKVADIADRLGMNPQHLMAVMSFETGGEFSSSTRNRVSGATGLIQFMPSTARGLGTSTAELAQMSPMQQLDFVEKYLKPYAGKMNSVEDAYMAVLWPAAVGKGPDHSLFSSPSVQYRQNSGLDTNGDGVVTSREAASKVRQRILG